MDPWMVKRYFRLLFLLFGMGSMFLIVNSIQNMEPIIDDTPITIFPKSRQLPGELPQKAAAEGQEEADETQRQLKDEEKIEEDKLKEQEEQVKAIEKKMEELKKAIKHFQDKRKKLNTHDLKQALEAEQRSNELTDLPSHLNYLVQKINNQIRQLNELITTSKAKLQELEAKEKYGKEQEQRYREKLKAIEAELKAAERLQEDIKLTGVSPICSYSGSKQSCEINLHGTMLEPEEPQTSLMIHCQDSCPLYIGLNKMSIKPDKNCLLKVAWNVNDGCFENENFKYQICQVGTDENNIETTCNHCEKDIFNIAATNEGYYRNEDIKQICLILRQENTEKGERCDIKGIVKFEFHESPPVGKAAVIACSQGKGNVHTHHHGSVHNTHHTQQHHQGHDHNDKHHQVHDHNDKHHQGHDHNDKHHQGHGHDNKHHQVHGHDKKHDQGHGHNDKHHDHHKHHETNSHIKEHKQASVKEETDENDEDTDNESFGIRIPVSYVPYTMTVALILAGFFSLFFVLS